MSKEKKRLVDNQNPIQQTIKKIKDWFKFEYDYWWNDFKTYEHWESCGLNPPGFKEKWRDLKYKLSNKIRVKCWEFKESFKWHVSCLLVFWKLPTALKRALDGLCASESIDNDTHNALENAEAKIETAIYYLADGMDDMDEKSAYRKAYRLIYFDEWIQHCPDKYLTEDESWDRAERGYENSRMSMTGGPMCDYRYSELAGAKYYLKKNNFKSRFACEFGEKEDGGYYD